MNSLFKTVLFPLLFALDMQVTLPGEEVEHGDDLVTFQFKRPCMACAPVVSFVSNPRVKTAYETAYLALSGGAAPRPELEGKEVLSTRSGSPIEQCAAAQMPRTVLQMMQDQSKMQCELTLKKKKSNPKTA